MTNSSIKIIYLHGTFSSHINDIFQYTQHHYDSINSFDVCIIEPKWYITNKEIIKCQKILIHDPYCEYDNYSGIHIYYPITYHYNKENIMELHKYFNTPQSNVPNVSADDYLYLLYLWTRSLFDKSIISTSHWNCIRALSIQYLISHTNYHLKYICSSKFIEQHFLQYTIKNMKNKLR